MGEPRTGWCNSLDSPAAERSTGPATSGTDSVPRFELSLRILDEQKSSRSSRESAGAAAPEGIGATGDSGRRTPASRKPGSSTPPGPASLLRRKARTTGTTAPHSSGVAPQGGLSTGVVPAPGVEPLLARAPSPNTLGPSSPPSAPTTTSAPADSAPTTSPIAPVVRSPSTTDVQVPTSSAPPAPAPVLAPAPSEPDNTTSSQVQTDQPPITTPTPVPTTLEPAPTTIDGPVTPVPPTLEPEMAPLCPTTTKKLACRP